MASKSKEAREDQSIYWGKKLEERLAFLKDKGVEPESAAKDPRIKQLRAKKRETEHRLRAIEKKEKRKDEVAGLKAERLAEKKEKTGKKKSAESQEQATSKRQMKKQKKREEKNKE
jgi:hypothetical protein